MKKLIIPTVIIVSFLIIITVIIITVSPKTKTQDPINEPTAGIIKVTPDTIDFGNIIQNEGPVSTTVTVSNTGTAPLELHRLSTSCGCTTAELDMSELEPNEERELTVTFDPMVHPDQFGPIIRVVYLQTSDTTMPEVEVDIRGNVIK